MGRFFNPDNFIWRFCSRVGDFFILSCMWLLGCLPVLTIAGSCVALFDSVSRCIRGKESGPWTRFLTTYKAQWKRSIFMTLLWTAIAFVLWCLYQLLLQSGLGPAVVMCYLVLMLVPLGTLCWVIVLESRFSNSFGQLHKNAFILALGYLPRTVALVALLLVTAWAIAILPFMLMLLPAITATLQSVFTEKVLRRFIPPEESPAEGE